MRYLPLLLLLGCYQPQGLEYIDEDLQQYWQQFQAEAQQRGVQLPNKDVMIYWEELDDDLGRCFHNRSTCRVRIDPAVKEMSPYVLEAVIFHELGHGLLDRDHMDRDTTNHWELSLMTVPHVGWPYYNLPEGKEYYVNELFGYEQN